ncbi:hypothetical protein KEU06_08715 [Pseudaminobacter sp. 19-2017]|uniref:Uncharacterized protein n=1 Tax=Pseudaminobacter soli (ex Zhang et al. 2022) TaxID=2831468 RepID=A0A942I2P3_9HYPH|nr:hypothetical protein [Pseudaminobacter soli]MBS3648709.1 hypothetical protein [Pseudaminobacter soli]
MKNPCRDLPPPRESPLRGVRYGVPDELVANEIELPGVGGPCILGTDMRMPDITGIPFVVVPDAGYVRDPVSGTFYVGPTCWANLKSIGAEPQDVGSRVAD